MTPTALSTILLRFIALGVAVYGIVLIAKGVFIHVEGDQMTSNMAALFDVPPSENQKLGLLATPFAKLAATLYVVGGGTILLGAFLYAGSNRLGWLIARDV
ncbi:hypothetical protein [Luteolibacter soli]|uniref:DUF1206 domain-containing protein n=1 Tax=Luteolibacter soli TaxID=3135280 RepID=A0ABU9B2D1_9BACT